MLSTAKASKRHAQRKTPAQSPGLGSNPGRFAHCQQVAGPSLFLFVVLFLHQRASPTGTTEKNGTSGGRLSFGRRASLAPLGGGVCARFATPTPFGFFLVLYRPREGELRHVRLHGPHFPTSITQLKQRNRTRLRFVLGHLVAFRMRLAASSFIPQLPRLEDGNERRPAYLHGSIGRSEKPLLEAHLRPPMSDPEPHVESHPPLVALCHDMNYVVVGCCAITQQP